MIISKSAIIMLLIFAVMSASTRDVEFAILCVLIANLNALIMIYNVLDERLK